MMNLCRLITQTVAFVMSCSKIAFARPVFTCAEKLMQGFPLDNFSISANHLGQIFQAVLLVAFWVWQPSIVDIWSLR